VTLSLQSTSNLHPDEKVKDSAKISPHRNASNLGYEVDLFSPEKTESSIIPQAISPIKTPRESH
jgi:hypothetical protein